MGTVLQDQQYSKSVGGVGENSPEKSEQATVINYIRSTLACLSTRTHMSAFQALSKNEKNLHCSHLQVQASPDIIIFSALTFSAL